jgi:glycosyltransferase involved in cell wall biosynthesis
MKIAIVLNTSWNVYNFRMGLIESLQNEGHEVYAVAPLDDYSKYLIQKGCKFERITMDSRGANPLKDIGLTVELYRIYRRIRPDVILHFTIKPNIYGSFAAQLLKIPVINNVCGLGTIFLNRGIVSLVAKIMYKLAFRYPKKVLFQNDADRELFLSKNLIQESRADVIPGSGINLEKFMYNSLPNKKEFTFLLISRLIHDKGILEYIEAIKKLKKKGINARFQLLGAIDEKHKRGIPESLINSWIDSNTVEYLGKVEDVREFIKKADCIVLPSYREGTPRTLLEASSIGRPIITTDVAGCNSVVVNDFNGLLCKVKDSSDLANKMEKMHNLSIEVRRAMGRRGHIRTESFFSEKLVVNKYLEEISKL